MTPTLPARTIDLKTWLKSPPDEARDAGHLIIGATGHLLLSAAEEENVVQHLEYGVLPRLIKPEEGFHVTLMTGLAPGADVLLTRAVVQWLRQRQVPYQIIGLLPVPPDMLIRDWADKALAADGHMREGRIETLREELQQIVAESSTLVDLVPDAATRERLDDPAVRQVQYQRLAAILAERAGVLIAILRGRSLELPGGTAEVVEWRRNLRLIPRDLSSLASARRRSSDARRQLVVLDPSVAYQAAGAAEVKDAATAVLGRARDALSAGNYLQCYDIIARARSRGVDSRALQYLTVLALVNAGSARLALRHYNEFEELGTESVDEDWRALKGRLLKDLAFRGGDDAQSLFLQSAKAYEEAYRVTAGTFSGINAASMYCLGDEAAQAKRLAQEVWQTLERRPPASDDEMYYWQVSRAEAALLLGDSRTCAEALEAANKRQVANVNARSRTRVQLSRLLKHLGQDQRMLEVLVLPPVIYLHRAAPHPNTELMQAKQSELRRCLWESRPLVFVGLVGPLELRAAEACLDQGALLYVSLAGDRAAEIIRWRHRYGDDITDRFARCVARAHEVSTAHGFLEDEERWCARYVDSMAFGLSVLASRRLTTDWKVLRVTDGTEEPLFDWQESEDLSLDTVRLSSGPLAHGAEPREESMPPNRRYVGLIFADFVGFSGLSDAALPVYWQQMMGAMAQTMQAHREKILFRHTWGDALHVVTSDAASAAEIATSIRATLDRLRTELGGELARLELRLSMHYAPVFIGHDPIEDAATYYGTQLSFAARIEPVTPPGVIFVTESFAARVMLEAPERFLLEYAGELELAKNFGKYRLFSLRKGA